MSTISLGFIGLGLMGDPMTRRLLEAGFDVTVWNRTPAKAEALGEAGARVVGSMRGGGHALPGQYRGGGTGGLRRGRGG